MTRVVCEAETLGCVGELDLALDQCVSAGTWGVLDSGIYTSFVLTVEAV